MQVRQKVRILVDSHQWYDERFQQICVRKVHLRCGRDSPEGQSMRLKLMRFAREQEGKDYGALWLWWRGKFHRAWAWETAQR